MLNDIIQLSRQLDQYVIALMLSIPRIFAFLSVSQLFNSSIIPGMARNAVIVALLFVVVPANMQLADEFDRSIPRFAILFAKEYAVGFLLGFLVSWIFWALEAAGSLIDNQRGTAIASSVDPLQGEEASTLGNLFSLAFVTYIFVTGSVLSLLGILYQSFALWPVSKMLPIVSEAFPALVLGIFDNAMRTMFILAAPVVAVMFLAEFSLAMISRFAPQVQVFILAMPIKSALAIMMLLFYASIMFKFADRRLQFGDGIAWAFYDLLDVGEKMLKQGHWSKGAGGAP